MKTAYSACALLALAIAGCSHKATDAGSQSAPGSAAAGSAEVANAQSNGEAPVAGDSGVGLGTGGNNSQ